MTPPDASSLATAASPVPMVQAPAEVVPFTTGEFAIPPGDVGEFLKLKDSERERILLLLSCFPLLATGNVVQQAQAMALRMSHLKGFSASNLKTLFYAYKANGWKALVRGYRGPQSLPEAFREYFRTECLKNSRSIRAQIGVIQRLWMAGEVIPGYGTWQEWFLRTFPERDMPRACPGFPNGWSESNLYTLQPPKAERVLKTRGYAAAKSYLPSVIRDTSNLRPLELIVIDDFEIDQNCVYLDPISGKREVCRVTGLLAMDVATRKRLALGLKPRITNDEGRMEAIQRHEVRHMLYCLLSEHGLPCGYPITILCENASAAIEHDLEMAFKHLFGGRIRVSRTGLIDCRTLSNGFIQGGGKPWEKGWIESGFNLMHNFAAVLPGQKGSRYDKKPAELAAKIFYTERLLSVGPQGLNLTDEQVRLLKLPFLSNDDLLQAYDVIFTLMEHRDNHKMIGFEAVQEWRNDAAEVWQPLESLALVPAEQQLGVCVRERPEKPIERWTRLNAHPDCQRAKIAEHALAALLLTPKKAKLRNGRVTFTHQGKGYTFADTAAYVLHEREGQEVMCYFDDQCADQVHVYSADSGEFIQSIQRLGPADITNPDSIAAAVRTVKAIENQTFAAVRARTVEEAAAVVGMIQHNEQVAPGVHLDAKIRRSLGLKADEAQKIAAPELPTVGLTKALAEGKKAGPLARDAFAGATSVVGAALQNADAKAKAKALQADDDFDPASLL